MIQGKKSNITYLRKNSPIRVNPTYSLRMIITCAIFADVRKIEYEFSYSRLYFCIPAGLNGNVNSIFSLAQTEIMCSNLNAKVDIKQTVRRLYGCSDQR